MGASVADRPAVRLSLGVLGVALLIGLWQSVGASGDVAFLVPPSDAVASMWDLLTGDRLTDDVLPSVARAIAGFTLGGAIGAVAGVLLGYFRQADPWVRPLLEFLRATPIPAVIPVAILALGASSGTQVGLIALGSLWPVLLNAMDGTRGVEPGYLDAARAAHLGPRRILTRVILPASMPQIFTGLRVGLALSLIMMVVSEMLSAGQGLGAFVLQAQRSFALNDMYGGILLLGLLGGAFTFLFAAAERRVLSWYTTQKGLTDA